MTTLRLLESVTRHAAIGIRFWDVATGNTVVEGLSVALFPRANQAARSLLQVNRSGVYVAHAVPGLRDFEFSDQPPDVLWATPTRPYRIELSDPAGRFLPCSFDVDLPVHGLLHLMAPWLPPKQMIRLPLDAGSASPSVTAGVPLFSAPARPLPEPLGVVHAQLRLRSSGAPAAWALLAVAIDGKPRGLGLADARGSVAVFFSYPDPPRRQLLSPPEQHNDFSWSVDFSAFPADDPPASERPDLVRVLGQLASPPVDIEWLQSPPLRLDYRVPLTARTPGGVGEDAASLFLAA